MAIMGFPCDEMLQSRVAHSVKAPVHFVSQAYCHFSAAAHVEIHPERHCSMGRPDPLPLPETHSYLHWA